MSQNFFEGAAVHDYASRPARQVPGFADLHRMIIQLLSERVPADASLLALGAGGGLELKAFADARPGWTFEGVDPSADMLALARTIAAEHVKRIELRQGYIEDASDGPFDAAVSILTFHFIAREQRLETLRQLRRRLRLGAPLVLAHISFPQGEPERSTWIARHVAYANPGTDPAQLQQSRDAIAARLTILSPDEEEAQMREAGFGGVSLFYAGLSFRGWIAYAE
ncbi:class I SAM-dependent methyltransferase [Devosia sp. FJ2-5-3]|uniref:class I SAM-dependent methyltransferase n=1 Tax=Devosia sp. FJ2-5-3 TaxID=2976680 RepID=UPI0023D85910|nr:class I SAM-dependent methyltransferase [Devosia sp. FJ2-5-3]WEJ59861.1 class I SAM-dependent methyltransferase [Devosia sp. FJ2-5-3]